MIIGSQENSVQRGRGSNVLAVPRILHSYMETLLLPVKAAFCIFPRVGNISGKILYISDNMFINILGRYWSVLTSSARTAGCHA